MRICIVYDCLFPWTVGGAERWMRNVAEALVEEGHEVTYLTRMQWPLEDPPRIPGVEVLAVSRAEALYGADGNRTIGEPLRFGWGVARHLLSHGRRYDVVHTASFPYFSLLAAGFLRRWGRYRLVTDWHEVWSDEYWSAYLGGLKGRIGRAVQRACARLHQEPFCFSELHAQRLKAIGLHGAVTVLRGEYGGSTRRPQPRPAEPLVVFAGRMIPDKQVPALVPAVLAAREHIPELRATLFGDGPQLAAVRAAIEAHDAGDLIAAPGFVDGDVVEDTMARATCLVLPSMREGYSAVVVEAASMGVPSVLVDYPDNAALEHIIEGVNGFVAPDAGAEALSAAIVVAYEQREILRASTAAWFVEHVDELSLSSSMREIADRYGPAASDGSQP
jgi:glycosyltransferase involved in cell wall biosynthesis